MAKHISSVVSGPNAADVLDGAAREGVVAEAAAVAPQGEVVRAGRHPQREAADVHAALDGEPPVLTYFDVGAGLDHVAAHLHLEALRGRSEAGPSVGRDRQGDRRQEGKQGSHDWRYTSGRRAVTARSPVWGLLPAV